MRPSNFPPVPALQPATPRILLQISYCRRGQIDPHRTVMARAISARAISAEMLFSCLISSVSAGLTNTASPSLTPPINDCVHGAMDHRYMVTLKQQAASSIGRRLDTREDRLSFLHDWFDKFTVGQHDSEGTYSNGATSSTSSGPQARLQQVQQAGHKLGSLTSTATSSVQTSSLPTHALHFFAETQLAVAVTDDKILTRDPQLKFAVLDNSNPPQWVGGLINHDRLKYSLGYKVFYSGVEGEHLTQSGGTKLPPDDVVLLPGWNWIGYAPLVSRDVNSGIEALSGNFTYDDQFKTRYGASVSFCTYSGSTLGFVGDLVELKPGVGYEVKVSRAITFAYTTTVQT